MIDTFKTTQLYFIGPNESCIIHNYFSMSHNILENDQLVVLHQKQLRDVCKSKTTTELQYVYMLKQVNNYYEGFYGVSK